MLFRPAFLLWERGGVGGCAGGGDRGRDRGCGAVAFRIALEDLATAIEILKRSEWDTCG